MKWDEIAVPCDLPETVDEINYERVIMNAGTTWDYIPWHFDPEYARNHGHPTIFVNTMHLAGFIDRIATAWAGPYSRVLRRKVTLVGSIYAGDSMVGRGRVIDKRREGSRDLVDLEVAINNQRDELCCPAEVTLDLSTPT
ncbi:MAG TPA: MaoC/PaaZ C-terminal domain-containing protein [Mycobacterium sp.]|nr:MaoC/PaaZ C-terminal domain-containing protein [Mycobacterium sp.]